MQAWFLEIQDTSVRWLWLEDSPPAWRKLCCSLWFFHSNHVSLSPFLRDEFHDSLKTFPTTYVSLSFSLQKYFLQKCFTQLNLVLVSSSQKTDTLCVNVHTCTGTYANTFTHTHTSLPFFFTQKYDLEIFHISSVELLNFFKHVHDRTLYKCIVWLYYLNVLEFI